MPFKNVIPSDGRVRQAKEHKPRDPYRTTALSCRYRRLKIFGATGISPLALAAFLRALVGMMIAGNPQSLRLSKVL